MRVRVCARVPVRAIGAAAGGRRLTHSQLKRSNLFCKE
nr:MAG TPA: hypothetical protein [Caudoviricetes sp.]